MARVTCRCGETLKVTSSDPDRVALSAMRGEDPGAPLHVGPRRPASPTTAMSGSTARAGGG